LKKHCDGNKCQLACSQRNKAIKAGANLPPTLKEVEANEKERNSGGLISLLESTTFESGMLNQILVMWLIQSALPWKQLEDFLLAVTLNYAQHGIKLYLHTWAATKAHRLYLNLQQKVVSELKVSFSHFHLY
jgi:hypothetical protein